MAAIAPGRSRLDLGHPAPALAHQPHAVLGAQRPAGGGGRVLAEAVARHEVRGDRPSSRASSVRARPTAKRAGWATSVLVSSSIGPSRQSLRTDEPGGLVGHPEVAVDELGVALGEVRAHAHLLRALAGKDEHELAHAATANARASATGRADPESPPRTPWPARRCATATPRAAPSPWRSAHLLGLAVEADRGRARGARSPPRRPVQAHLSSDPRAECLAHRLLRRPPGRQVLVPARPCAAVVALAVGEQPLLGDFACFVTRRATRSISTRSAPTRNPEGGVWAGHRPSVWRSV